MPRPVLLIAPVLLAAAPLKVRLLAALLTSKLPVVPAARVKLRSMLTLVPL